MTWTIEAKLLPLVGISGHLYLEIFDDKGNRVTQINGFAADPKTHKAHQIGLPGHVLQAFVTPPVILDETTGATRDNHPHQGQVLYKGTQQDIEKAIAAFEKAAVEINKLNLPYKVFSQNSNSVFMYMVDVLSTALPIRLDGIQKLYDSKWYLPGVNQQILGRGGYESLKKRFNEAAQKKPARAPKRKLQPRILKQHH